MKLIITQGVSASGKTTWANQYRQANPETAIVCRDDIRWEMMKEKGLYPCWKNWKFKWESEVTRLWNNRLAYFRAMVADRGGGEIIIADTNLDLGKLSGIIEEFKKDGFEVEIKTFHVTWEEAVRRDNEREHGVGVSVLARQFEKLYKTEYKHRFDSRDAIVVDIDGTLAHMNGRSPFDWDKVASDSPDDVVCDIVEGLSVSYDVIVVSGRDGVCREATECWLKRMLGGIKFSLFMRAEGDNRQDTIVKKEIFDEHIAPNYNVHCVIDDRPSVCRMWRSLGLKVIQVGNPYIEF